MYLRAFGVEGGSGTAPGSPARDMWQVDEVEHEYQLYLMYHQGIFDILQRELAQGAAPATMPAGGAPSNELHAEKAPVLLRPEWHSSLMRGPLSGKNVVLYQLSVCRL